MRWRDLYSQKRSLNLRKERQQRRRLEDSMVSDIFMGGGGGGGTLPAHPENFHLMAVTYQAL